jgi:hypothetical protein
MAQGRLTSRSQQIFEPFRQACAPRRTVSKTRPCRNDIAGQGRPPVGRNCSKSAFSECDVEDSRGLRPVIPLSPDYVYRTVSKTRPCRNDIAGQGRPPGIHRLGASRLNPRTTSLSTHSSTCTMAAFLVNWTPLVDLTSHYGSRIH